MLWRNPIAAVAMAAALLMTIRGAQAFDDALYPDWSGAWDRIGSGNFDPSKPRGLGQEAPLTAEYQKILEASVAAQTRGGQGSDPTYRCYLHGMPRIMIGVLPIQFVIMPGTTYVMPELESALRRIYTDGRDWPARLQRSADGYSIGRWLDEDGDGRYDTLEVETRALKNPRVYDSSGAPFHQDEATIVMERIYLDKTNPDILRNEITTIDHALTRPWTVIRSYRRIRNFTWTENICSEDNRHVVIANEDYLVSWDGFLMPVDRGQKAPDLRYFDQPRQ
jgi:hypothetical protein